MVHTTTQRKSNRIDQQRQHCTTTRNRTRRTRTRRNTTTTSEQTTKEGAAVQWIQNLQLCSIDDDHQQLIAESASSKFLIGDGATTSLAAVLGAGAGATLTTSAAAGVATPSPTRGGIPSTTTISSSSSSQQQPLSTGSVGMMLTPEEVVKAALGMPHPLCRSSTIEAGPFTLGIHR